jgi:hypothetical protein
MSTKYLFLDFDGTLLPRSYEQYLIAIHNLYPEVPVKDEFGYFFSPGAIYLLAKLLRRHPLEVVITSRWNVDFSLAELQRMWAQRRYPGNVVGVTTATEGVSRGYEIEQWLVSRGRFASTDYLILDDMAPSGFYAIHRERLVEVNTALGLSTKDYQKALTLLAE